MNFKFDIKRAKELLVIFVVVGIALFTFINMSGVGIFDLDLQFVFKSLIEPFKSILWNNNSRILTPISISIMVISFFIENKYFRLPMMLISVVFYYFIGIAVVVTET